MAMSRIWFSAGFSLLEMALVLLIVGLLLSGGLSVLGAQRDLQQQRATRQLLEEVRESLLGFAMAHGRLPCPASPAPGAQGIESPPGGGACTHPYNGLLPAVTLGLPGVDQQGFLTDAWGLPANRLRYAVTTAHDNSATTAGGIRATSMGVFAPNLSVCASSNGISSTSCGSAVALTNTAVAVIFSLGKNASNLNSAGHQVGPDENRNLDDTRFFVSHPPTAHGAIHGEFDDIVTWLSSNVLYSRLVQAGQLP